ncbi:hypothetical protein ETB97_010374 [Aspergillus alliaceus]|uniref:Isoprenoid synthase domain-containing protein n=1 Tax=Petromyces alliaceus TaxID=209559 RepID=A0A8H6E8C0_PETAA|nr:hypothetical protein ETB97_010374 [Aspergillus burnettii]
MSYTATLPFDRGPLHPIRPVHYSYDPVHTTPDSPKHDLFDYLSTAAKEDPALHRSSFCLEPEKLGVSWQTFFPACRQSRQWRDAEDAAQELTDKLFRTGGSSRNGYCKKWRDLAEILQVVEMAVACAVYTYPRADVVRIRLLAQLHVVIWIHDDVLGIVEREQGEPEKDRSFPPTPTRKGSNVKSNSICGIISSILQEILQVDSTIGFDVAAGALKWHRMSRAHCNSDLTINRFMTLSDYLEARIGDPATDIHLSMIRFAASIHLSHEQGQDPILKDIVSLWAKHRIIVNDLFSYEKECLEHAVHDSAIVNVVKFLQGELDVSLETAKEVARNIQLDTEREIHGLYKDILNRTGPDSTDARYVRALVESLAGNVFSSSTAGRNAMPL